MAREKKNPEDFSVEQKLKNLYQLQTILSEIDKIKRLRGELPLEVQDLEDEIVGLNTRVEKLQGEINYLKGEISAQKVAIEKAKDSIKKYQEQQNNVRNNREFDFLSKEIEFQTLEVQLCEKKIADFNRQVEENNNELARSQETLSDRTKDLEEKKGELDEIVHETKAEEERLREKAKNLEGSIDPRLLAAFNRIRKSSRNGLGIVYVQRDACGGCFNKIPPQRQLDIRMRKKIIVCEYCGRIMIDKELAGVKD
ncbi:MAG: zinc ribbon domain-containing protein [Bacteroidaceae bacterium]|jgi:predicted  nucleic acid-binding Zn-ribbon protein